MIHYQLRCDQDHEFDGWFNDSAGFEKQAKRGLIECPTCGATKVSRALMAPAVSTRDAPEPKPPVPVQQVLAARRPAGSIRRRADAGADDRDAAAHPRAC